MSKNGIEGYAALDFEASSLSAHSWPIEVGISWIEEKQVKTWSSLIRPHPVWDTSDWSSKSEAVHGIPLLDLQAAPPAAQVASELLTMASGLILTSDAPEFEFHWLSRLFDAWGCAQAHEIEDFHAVSFRLYSGFALDMLYETLEQTKVPHRAGPDSARLAGGWLKALEIEARENQ
jgi:DNA polymerase III epsilon subunit-like protein